MKKKKDNNSGCAIAAICLSALLNITICLIVVDRLSMYA